jgi:glycosyltransferase involved in cell wall biosynthesis
MNGQERSAGACSERMNVLISAYACEPGKGSEAGVGWNLALHMSSLHNVWVLTRANNRAPIEGGLPENCTAKFIYYDLPAWARWWKRGARGAQLYYYLWQVCAGRMLRKHYRGRFDVGHHITFVRYWVPTCFAGLGIPYLIGPVGGGELAPPVFERRFSWRAHLYERGRRVIRWAVRFDPLLRSSIRNASHIIATTEESAVRIRELGAPRVSLYPESGVSQSEYRALAGQPQPASRDPLVLISSGRLLALKGFDLGLAAFARADLPRAEYWVLGDGPERKRLVTLANRLGVADRMHFLGWLPRADALRTMASAHILVHPSLHDSGGWVCPEAMALGKPVICLHLGGPGTQVTDNTGIRVQPSSYEDTLDALADAMRQLAGDPDRCAAMGHAGRREVANRYIWENKCVHYSSLYEAMRKDAELHANAQP